MEQQNNTNEQTPKRFYTGWRAIKDTILSYSKDGKTVEMTAVQIAKTHNFNPKSVRISARRMGITLAKDKRGGNRRVPSDKKIDTVCSEDTHREKPSVS